MAHTLKGIVASANPKAEKIKFDNELLCITENPLQSGSSLQPICKGTATFFSIFPPIEKT